VLLESAAGWAAPLGLDGRGRLFRFMAASLAEDHWSLGIDHLAPQALPLCH
jgi:hypothetical protein